MMSDQVSIKHPRSSNTGRLAVPRRFVAAGTAKGDSIRGVQGRITLLNQQNNPVSNPVLGVNAFEGTPLFFVEKPSRQGSKYRWMLFFQLAPERKGKYRLDVIGLDSEGRPIDDSSDDVDIFEVHERDRFVEPALEGIAPLEPVLVEIGYPPSDHVLSGSERDYFVAYGSTDHQILSAEIKFDATTINKAADTVYDNLTTNFWSAQFSELASSESQQILDVQDTSNDGSQRNISIAN
jgi:hypothetical protein